MIIESVGEVGRRGRVRSFVAGERQETVMALLDSAHHIRTTRAPSKRFTEREFHPSICLATGFGVIFGAAAVVHFAFKILM